MKLATKKFFHNVLALVVSVCMVCTLTPSAAWGTGSSETSSEEAPRSTSASSEVKGRVIDEDYKFTITAGENFENVDDFIKALNDGKFSLEASMKKDVIPDSYTVEWFVQEVQENKDFDSTKPEGADNKKTKLVGDATKISEKAYTKDNTPTTDNVPTFAYPNSDGMIYSPDQLKSSPISMADRKLYEFSIVMKNNDGDETSARTLITFMPDYNKITLNGIPAETAGDFMAEGDIYTSFSIPMTFPQLSVGTTGESSADYTVLQNKAADHDEEIVTANQLAITYAGNAPNLPEGQDPYLSSEAGNGLSVYIPLPEGVDGKDAKVYGLTQTKGETSPSVKTYPCEVVELGEDGAKYKAVKILVQDTGATLGSFAIATPMTEFYTTYVSVDQGGIISPSGTDGVVSGCSLVKAKEFSALALSPGYALTGFSKVKIESGNSSREVSPDVSGNVLTFDPTKHGIKNGDKVYIHANFEKVEKPSENQSPTTSSVTASLSGKDGAKGTMTISAAQAYKDAPEATIGMGETKSLGRVNNDAGLFLKFAPESPDYVIDFVTVNDSELKFDHTALEVMIGALKDDTNIKVGYRKIIDGEPSPYDPNLPTVNVEGVINTTGWPAGYIRAMLVINGVPSQKDFEHKYETNFGASQTIQLRHTKNYRVEATQIDSNGVETDVTDKMVTGETLDSITVYNVTNDLQIVFDYIPKEAELGGTAGPGGSGSIIVPTQQSTNTNAQSKAKMRTMAARADTNENTTIVDANDELAEGNRARILAYPAPGYELGRVEINGTNVTEYFKPHYRNNSLHHLTMTVYRTETGIIPAEPNQGEWDLEGWDGLLKDEIIDNVVPIEGTIATLVMTFNPKVPTSAAYQTITTQVEGIGGTITPSLKVEQNTKATIEFFPDDTYKVDAYKIDNGSWVTPTKNDASSLKCEVNVGTSDHTVTVRFAPGSTEYVPTYTITPMIMNAGGTVSPSQPVKVHEMGPNDSFNFSILPKTGYRLATDPTLEGSGHLERNGYTCTITNVKSDCNLVVSFSSDEASNNDPTHVVRARCVDGEDDWTPGYVAKGGIAKPASPFTVADGADANFTFLPNDGWYVKGVYVVGSTTPSTPDLDDDIVTKKDRGINLVGSVQDGRMFSLRDVQDDTIIEVVFDELKNLPDDEQEKHKPPTLDEGTFKLDPSKNAEIGEGATISPDLNDMVFVKVTDADGTHAAAGADLTIIISSGYELDGEKDNGGITIKNGDKDVTGNVTVRPAGDGLYEVKIPAKNVTEDMKIIVNTKKDPASQGVVNKASVTVKATGQGTVSPAGIAGKVYVESGKSQTFSFIPADGWKLHRVYVNDEVVNVTGNAYTIHNIMGDDTMVQAVFVEGEQQPPVVPRTVNVINNDSTGTKGTVTPSGAIQVVNNAALSILVEPKAGYQAVAYEGTSRAAGKEIPIAGNTIELANITTNRTITVYFDPIGSADFVSLAISYSDGGTVSPAGNTLISKGKSQTLSILPDPGKAVKRLWVTTGDSTSGADKTADVKATPNATNPTGIIYTTGALNEKTSIYVEFTDKSDNDRRKDLPDGDKLREPDGKDTYHALTAFVGGGGGTVTPTYAKVADGANITYTFVALEGYHFASATIDGNRIPANSIKDNAYELTNVRAAHELVAVFEKDKSGNADLEKYYTVFASAKGDGSKVLKSDVEAGGTISPAGPVTVAGGGSQSFTIIPDPNCKVASITITNTSNHAVTTVNGADFKGSSYTLFSVSNDMAFTVIFTALKEGEAGPSTFMTHSINASASLNGSISPAGTRTVDHGGDAMFTFIPWDGYKLSYIIVDGANIPAKAINNMQYTFPKVTENHTIHAVFIGENEKAADFATLNVTCGSNGTVTPGGSLLVEVGGSTTIDVTPFLRYKVGDIKIGPASLENGVSLGLSDYTSSTKSGTINVGGKEVGYTWGNGQLRLTNIQDQTFVGVTFAEDKSSPTNPDTVPTYEKIGTNVTGGGTTSIQPNPIYVQEPGDVSSTDPDYNDKTTMDVSIVPEDGKIAKEITITYGGSTSSDYSDGGKTVIKDDGTYTYDKDGNLVKKDDSPTIQDVYEKGFITVDTDRGSVDIDVKYEDKTGAENDYTPATFFDVNVTYSAGGTVGPSGTPVKVAKGSRLTLQMIPSANYDIATVTVNGTNKTSQVLPDTRTFVLGGKEGVQANTNVNVTFGFVKSDDESGDKDKATHTVTTRVVNPDEGAGTISPAEDIVPDGSSETIYFAPAAGYKINTVWVTRGEKTDTYSNSNPTAETPAFNSPSMAIRNITSDVTVEVEYVRAAPGEQTWTVKTVPLTVKVGAGQGDVSPTYSEPIAGSATEVRFYPAAEWTASYYTLNGKTYTLPANVSSVPITPDPSAEGPDANVMEVFFEHYGAEVDQNINVKLVDSGDGQYHGAATPSQASVAYGGSTTFYVYPEISATSLKGYTIDYVRFNGVEQAKEGVISSEYSNKATTTVTDGTFPSTPTSSKVTESDVNRLTSAGNTYYNAYKITLNDVVTSGILEVKFKPIPNGTANIVTTALNKMTITSEGGGMVSPLGEVVVPEGETVDILTTTFESYYLYSVIKTDDEGTTDLTANVQGRVAKATMGHSNCTVKVTFQRVNQTPDADVNVSLKKATYNGKDITADVQVGSYVDEDGNVVPIKLNSQGVLCDSATDEPIKYVRGGSYEFYFDPQVKGDHGRDLVLSSATYAGQSQSVIPGANYLTNVVVNASGGFELEFRELEEGEQPLNPANGYNVYVYAENPDGTDGIVTPAGPFTRQPGGSVTIAFSSESNDDTVAVSYIFLQHLDDSGLPMAPEDVPPSEYADGTYTLSNIDRDYEIHVVFQKYSIVRVNWDNSLGFVTPNHAPGSYIYRPVDMANIDFLVAPYEGSELVGVYAGSSADSMAEVVTSDDKKYEKNLKDKLAELGLIEPEEPEEPGGITTMGLEEKPDTVVEPMSYDFAKVFGTSVQLNKSGNTYVTAQFKDTRVNQPHTIKATVKNGHGTVSPSGDVEVPYGAAQTFTASAETGYTVIGLVVDGNRVPAASTYTFSNVIADHTIEFEFGLPQAAGGGAGGSGADRLLRVASKLAQTGDLTGPVVGLFLVIAAAGLVVTGVSYIRRQQRRRQRREAMAARQG